MDVNNIHMSANNIQFTKIEIQIAKYIFRHYRDRYNARQLARILGINHAHTNKLCNALADKNLLVKVRIGNSAYFSFDYRNRLALRFMEYLVGLEEKEFPGWLVLPLHNLRKFKPYTSLGLVFGSSVNTSDYHDIDVFLMYDSENSKEVQRVKDEIMTAGQLEKPVRYVDITEKDILSNKDDKVFYNIMSGNLVFHGPEKYVEVIRKCQRLMST